MTRYRTQGFCTHLDYRQSLRNCLILFFVICLLSTGSASSVSSSPLRTSPTQKPYVIDNIRYQPIPSSAGYSERGIASWYGPDFHGRPTSNGEQYNMFAMTAAHKTLPMHTVLLVSNLENGLEVVVRVNDRGPFVRGRILDLSYQAAKHLDMIGSGTARVEIQALAEASLLADSRKGTRPLPNLRQGEYYVQIGSFSRKENAFKLQKRFTNAGHTTIIQKFYGSNSIYYRVQVYVGKELTRAKRAETALLENGYKGAFVVAR